MDGVVDDDAVGFGARNTTWIPLSRADDGFGGGSEPIHREMGHLAGKTGGLGRVDIRDHSLNGVDQLNST